MEFYCFMFLAHFKERQLNFRFLYIFIESVHLLFRMIYTSIWMFFFINFKFGVNRPFRILFLVKLSIIHLIFFFGFLHISLTVYSFNIGRFFFFFFDSLSVLRLLSIWQCKELCITAFTYTIFI